MSRDRRYCAFILACIRQIEEYTAAGQKAYYATPMIRDAVERNLEKLSDTARKLTEELQARHPEIPWRNIKGFRNVLAHDTDDSGA